MKSVSEDIADPKLYRLYWSLMLRDILFYLGYDATRENKRILHEFHKRVLKYDSTAGKTHEIFSLFIFEVGIFWSERGIFVRTNRKQEIGIELRPLSEIWDKL